MNTRPPDDRDAPLARNLGRFFGSIKRGFTEPVKHGSTKPDRVETRRETTEETRDTPHGEVTLRRTVIEEVTLPPGLPAARPGSPAAPSDRPDATEDGADKSSHEPDDRPRDAP